MYSNEIKSQAQYLRRTGRTYSEIRATIGISIPQATLSYWLTSIPLLLRHKKRIAALNARNLATGRKVRILQRSESKKKNFADLKEEFCKPIKALTIPQKKLLLSVLYLGEGGKRAQRSSVMFGNSDPKVIKIFLRLMRSAYSLDESKFRCTVQCRADQDFQSLQRFWSKNTAIPIKKFLKVQIDKRSIDKPTRKKNYRGVLRIDYYSANIFHELMNLADILNEGL